MTELQLDYILISHQHVENHHTIDRLMWIIMAAWFLAGPKSVGDSVLLENACLNSEAPSDADDTVAVDRFWNGKMARIHRQCIV